MASIPVAREIEDAGKVDLRAAVVVVHSETADPPSADHVHRVLRGTARSDPSMSYAIYGGSSKFALSSDRGSGKIAVYRDRESLRAAIYSFLARAVRRDLRDAVATYAAANERASFGGFEAKRWTAVRQDPSARSPDRIVADIAGGLPATPEAVPQPAMTAAARGSTRCPCAAENRRRWFPVLTLVGVAMLVGLVAAAIAALRKRRQRAAFGELAGNALDEAPLVGDLMDDLVVIP